MCKLPAFLAFLFLFPGIAASQEATPNHVYQITENIVAELEEFHKHNYSKPKYIDVDLAPRRPRHVYQKARQIFQKVQFLRFLNGLPPLAVKPFPDREIKPADVRKLVHDIHEGLVEMRTIYALEGKSSSVPLPSGKKPTDVYKNLIKISTSIDSLGIPTVVPNDVYQVASTILVQLTKLANHQGKTFDLSQVEAEIGKTPKDVYDALFELMRELERLTQNRQYAIPGGIVLLNPTTGKVRPADVLDLMNNVLADVSAIKTKLGVKSKKTLAKFQSGKTPSDVYQAVQQARTIVGVL